VREVLRKLQRKSNVKYPIKFDVYNIAKKTISTSSLAIGLSNNDKGEIGSDNNSEIFSKRVQLVKAR